MHRSHSDASAAPDPRSGSSRTTGREPVIVSWSGGKDSALAFARLQVDPRVQVVALLTSVTAAYDRVSIHGVRRPLLHAQARSVGVPVIEIELDPVTSNDGYEHAFARALNEPQIIAMGARTIAFGDIFLEDVRKYREGLAGALGYRTLFPLWGDSTRDLADEILARRIMARLVCVDTTVLDAAFAGRLYDDSLLSALPEGIDPCGENGEFHTFVSDGPGFRAPVPYETGDVVLRDQRFAFCDLRMSQDAGDHPPPRNRPVLR